MRMERRWRKEVEFIAKWNRWYGTENDGTEA